jgi:RNA polymerase sigma-70 factor (ECF subfamily)
MTTDPGQELARFAEMLAGNLKAIPPSGTVRIAAIERASWSDVTAKLKDFVGRRIRNPSDRDDVVQDVLLRVLANLSDLRKPENAAPWIYRIARNAIIDHWRRTAGSTTYPLSDDCDAAEAENEDAVLQGVAAHLHLLVGCLPEPYRTALALTELEGLTHRVACDRVGVSLSAMKTRVRRGRLMLKDLLEACCRLDITPSGNLIDYEPKGRVHRPICRT